MSKVTKPMTYLMLLLIVGIFIAMISNFGENLLNSDKSDLSNESKEYINNLNGNGKEVGFDNSFIDERVDNPILNETGDNKNEFSLDFNFGKNKANKLSRFFYIVTSIPEVLIKDIFRLSELKWFVDILDWFWRLAIFISIYYFIRGIAQT